MLVELRKLQRFILDTYLTNQVENSLELLNIKEDIIKNSESFLEILSGRILPIAREAKQEILAYCIEYLYKVCLLDTSAMGLPWAAIQLDNKYNRYSSSIRVTASYLNITFEELQHQLNNLASYYIYKDKAYEDDCKEALSISDAIYNRRSSENKSLDMKDLPSISMNKVTSDFCIGEILAENTFSIITDLIEMHAHTTYGSANQFLTLPKIFDYVSYLNFALFVDFDSGYNIKNNDVQNLLSSINAIPFRPNYENTDRHKLELTTSHIKVKLTDPPLIWQGKGTELLDLFVTLQEKGFIELPGTTTAVGPTWETVCKAICGLFDLSKFRRASSQGEPWETLVTYFKTRSRDKMTGESRYDKLSYDKRKFDSIAHRTPDLPDPT